MKLSLYLSLTSLAASPRISSACCRAPEYKKTLNDSKKTAVIMMIMAMVMMVMTMVTMTVRMMMMMTMMMTL